MLSTEVKNDRPKVLKKYLDAGSHRGSLLADRVAILEARLMATASVLDTLVSLGKVDPAYQETVQRVLRHAHSALEGV